MRRDIYSRARYSSRLQEKCVEIFTRELDILLGCKRNTLVEESALLVPQVKLSGAFEIRLLETCWLAIGLAPSPYSISSPGLLWL